MAGGAATQADEAAVARHYDALDQFYRELWGEHVHHGLWTTGRESVEEATRALVDLVAHWAGVQPGAQVADAGCGYGGTARVLAGAYGCQVVGFTLSAAQAAWACERGGGVRYEVRSWLANGLADGSCDSVVAIESLSHMVDKPVAFSEAARVLRPGGRLVLVDWLSAEQPSRVARRWLLDPIAREGRLPSLHSLAGYEQFAGHAGLRVLHTEDLSPRARRTWSIVGGRLARRLLSDGEARRFLLSARNPDRAFALSLVRIPLALRIGSMRLCLLVAERPTAPGHN
ncbi:MAG TPA: class I SAM-dependent methyltransferase [Solirubrobacteraceae bacterium]|jgi:tocopherol O-methyltransferase|nr:class I SAM-dependent methyltransferase [Solirubrobacteraceae bacterium]